MTLRLICILVVLNPMARFAAGVDDVAMPKITEITLTRSGDDAGPEDVLTLRADGSALYVGKRNVDRIGSYTGTIPRYGFSDSYPLLAGMYESLHGQPRSTGKPTGKVTAITWSIIREGKVEEVDDLCPGIDPRLWAFEMAVRGVAADVVWKRSADAKDSSAPHVELKLAPSTAMPDESTLAALSANLWSWSSLANILGAGSTRTLHFTREAGGQLKLEAVMHHIKGVNERNMAVGDVPDVVERTTCEVRGAVLRCGERPRTFAVVQGKKLVMNALAPAGERRWYYAAAECDVEGNVARVEEYLFNFTDDPLNTDAGKGSMRVRGGDYPPKADDIHFKLTRAEYGMRYFLIQTDGPDGPATRARIGLATDGDYGLMLDNLNLNSVVFTSP